MLMQMNLSVETVDAIIIALTFHIEKAKELGLVTYVEKQEEALSILEEYLKA